jgi:hypothetical protein
MEGIHKRLPSHSFILRQIFYVVSPYKRARYYIRGWMEMQGRVRKGKLCNSEIAKNPDQERKRRVYKRSCCILRMSRHGVQLHAAAGVR